jgi:hypothetical protein
MQLSLFEDDPRVKTEPLGKTSGTFTPNLRLPVHRWFRYSAGFATEWVASVIESEKHRHAPVVFDPFAGSGTTLIAAENCGVESWGIDAHPFVARVAEAKLAWRSDPESYRKMAESVLNVARTTTPDTAHYPDLIQRCFEPIALAGLDRLRRASDLVLDDSPAAKLTWLTLVAILRRVSSAGTAQWQYILPSRQKRCPSEPFRAYQETIIMISEDMQTGARLTSPRAKFDLGDSRTCLPVTDHFANLVITSPPYPNNYDYADATRLEMCFFGEISGWGCLQESVRRHLVVSCSQHVPPSSAKLGAILREPVLQPIKNELAAVCGELETVRETKGGKKTYHLMIASYFRDLAKTWIALRRVCQNPSRVCFVIGDSAPYGVYVPVVPWLFRLAEAAGFNNPMFEKIRDRNIKWKNRKHRVPLQEGRLWAEG